MTRLKEDAAGVAKEHSDALRIQNNMIESLQSTITSQTIKIDTLTKQYNTAVIDHNNSYTNQTQLYNDLQLKFNDLSIDNQKKSVALVDWEKKMSLFEIMKEIEDESKAREMALRNELDKLLALREQDKIESELYYTNWKYTLDQLNMTNNDTFYLNLLTNERNNIIKLNMRFS